MSFRANRNQQITLNDRTTQLTDRELNVLRNSWAETFANEVFPEINEKRFSVLFNDEGRSNTPVNVVIGSLLIKEMLDLTDDEILEAVMLNIQVQYSLHLTSFKEIPFSDRTLSRFRARLLQYEEKTGIDLLKMEVLSLAELAKVKLGVSDRLRRMDSLMVSSNCKRMARLELFYTCTAALVSVYAKDKGETCLPEQLVRYTKAEDKNATIYRAKSGEAQERLEIVFADALLIKGLCDGEFDDCEEYKLLVRMLDDQTEGGNLKKGKDIKPTSLQNPSDGDATFRRKAGKEHTGYVANIVESCGEDTNIIDDYAFEQNIHSDQAFAADIINSYGDDAEGAVIVCDGGYASEKNFDNAEDKNIELATTCLTGAEPNKILLDFEIAGDAITGCPAGHKPYDTYYNRRTETLNAYFEKGTCCACPYKDQCPVIMQKKRAVVRFTDTSYNRAVQAVKIDGERYKELAKKRNGIEGVPSVLRRKFNVDSMPIFGMARSKLWFGIKIAAVNVCRLVAALKRQDPATGVVCPI